MEKETLKQKLLPSIIILVIAGIAMFKLLDGYVANYISGSVKDGALIYAAARGINSLVSMAQTITLETGMFVTGSISIGEILDPLNDLIERFSSVMTLALGALIGMKILLIISSYDFVNYLILLLALANIYAIFFSWENQRSSILKLFLVMVFIRFSLVIIIGLNGITDQIFLAKNITAEEQKIEQFKHQLNLDKLNKRTQM